MNCPDTHVLCTPFYPGWIDDLNTYQNLGYVHPFTCPRSDEHPLGDSVLVATRDGWHCPSCDQIVQDWAYDWMIGERLQQIVEAFGLLLTGLMETT
jgi:hypothetical protein